MTKIILLPDGVEHGTRYAYTHYKCRCLDCTWANKEARIAWKAKNWGKEPPSHGTENGYGNYGCRCDECRASHSAYMKAYHESRQA